MTQLFEYTLADASGFPVTQISVYGGKTNGFVCTRIGGKCRYLTPPAWDAFKIDGTTLNTIRDLIENLDVTDIERRRHRMVMNGYINEFSYTTSLNEKPIKLYSDNISVCKERPELYPNTMALIKLLGKLQDLLTPLGISEKCFSINGCNPVHIRPNQRKFF